MDDEYVIEEELPTGYQINPTRNWLQVLSYSFTLPHKIIIFFIMLKIVLPILISICQAR